LRLAYVSSDFGNHPTLDLMQSMFCFHRTDIELFCINLCKSDHSGYSRSLISVIEQRAEKRRQKHERKTKHYIEIPEDVSGKEGAEIIRKLDLDVLVELNGHTAGSRLDILAHRPAPVQITYLGYPGSMGSAFIDYVVADKYCIRPSDTHYYTEPILLMPHCYQVNSFRHAYANVDGRDKQELRREYGIPDDKVVYCNLGRLGRIDQDLFDTWLSILKSVPNSLLWLYKHPKVAALRLLRRMHEENISRDRIVFAGPAAPKEDHLRRLAAADVYLDTLSYNGHTTGSDAVWAGLPMVTMKGETWASRVGHCLAACMDIDGMEAAQSLEEYKTKAIELGNNSQKRKEIRTEIMSKRFSNPLFDTERWTRNFEVAVASCACLSPRVFPNSKERAEAPLKTAMEGDLLYVPDVAIQ